MGNLELNIYWSEHYTQPTGAFEPPNCRLVASSFPEVAVAPRVGGPCQESLDEPLNQDPVKLVDLDEPSPKSRVQLVLGFRPPS